MTNQSNSTQDTEDVVRWLTELAEFSEAANGNHLRGVHPATVTKGFRRSVKLIQSLSDRIDVLTQALNVFARSAYPVATEINERGHNWCEAYLDEALTIARAALHQEGIAP